MSTGAIIAIVVAALILLALLAFVLPKMRARSEARRRERELDRRRQEEIQRHRGEAESRQLRADEAEHRARIAQKEAEAERAQAEAHEARASLHERGLAEDDVSAEGATATTRADDARAGDPSRDAERSGTDRFDRTRDRDADGTVGASAPTNEYERGRRDEALDEERRRT